MYVFEESMCCRSVEVLTKSPFCLGGVEAGLVFLQYPNKTVGVIIFLRLPQSTQPAVEFEKTHTHARTPMQFFYTQQNIQLSFGNRTYLCLSRTRRGPMSITTSVAQPSHTSGKNMRTPATASVHLVETRGKTTDGRSQHTIQSKVVSYGTLCFFGVLPNMRVGLALLYCSRAGIFEGRLGKCRYTAWWLWKVERSKKGGQLT